MSDPNEIDRHSQSDQRQKESKRDTLGRRPGASRFAEIQLPDQSEVVPSGKNIHDYTNCAI